MLNIVLHLGFVWYDSLKGGILSCGDVCSGGWHWQAASINLWESFTCVAICYGLLVIYAREFDSQGHSRNPFRYAGTVDVFHPILILDARALHSLAWPAIPKFCLLTTIAAVASFALSAAVFRRIPLLRDIL